MMEWLAGWDLTLLHAVNRGWASPSADLFFKFVTHQNNFAIPALFFLGGLLVKGGAKGRWLVAALLLNILLTDQISSHVIKHLVDRPRPCQALSDVRTPDGCGPASSFPSSHAANSGGLMTMLSLAYPAWTPLAAAFALTVGLSRVYLGVHYPSDVLGGFVLGVLCAFAVWRLKGWAEARWPGKRETTGREDENK
jgi:undecaprenyl-diphosphatase